MIRKYEENDTSPYTPEQEQEILKVTTFLATSISANDTRLSELERDYIKYYKKCLWRGSSLPFLAGAICYLTIDKFPPMSKLTPLPRYFFKLSAFSLFIYFGLHSGTQQILKFPLMNQVIAESLLKYKGELNN